MFSPIAILAIPVFLFSLTIHEFAHAWMAMKGGDLTAAYQGRLTFNPLAHLDPIGTMMIVLGALTGLPVIGWAKPVPVNAMNFRRASWGMYVALGGPGSNLALALVFGLLFRLLPLLGLSYVGHDQNVRLIYTLATLFVYSNICLAIFNMIPVPPLDGSHVFFHLFVRRRDWVFDAFVFLERFGFLILFLLLFASPVGRLFGRAILNVSGLILGINPMIIFSYS